MVACERVRTVMCAFVLGAVIVSSQACGPPSASKVRYDLWQSGLAGYDSQIRPHEARPYAAAESQGSSAEMIDVRLLAVQLISVDERASELTLSVVVRTKWSDWRLRFNQTSCIVPPSPPPGPVNPTVDWRTDVVYPGSVLSEIWSPDVCVVLGLEPRDIRGG
jgi:hypothetical protein